MKYFMILSPVGPHLPGQVVAISPDDEKRGVHAARLIELNVAREATEDESADAVLFGTTDPDRYLNPIPRVEPKLEAVKKVSVKADSKSGKE